MNWKTMVTGARFHLADRFSYTALPWAVLAFDFAVWLLLAARGSPVSVDALIGLIFLWFHFLLLAL